MAKIGEGPKATRMELLALRRRIALAKRGHELLEEKRDALIAKFFELIKKRKELREKLSSELKEIYMKFKEAKATLGGDIYSAIAAVPEISDLKIDRRIVMGVRTEEIRGYSWEPKYSLYATSGAFDEMLKKMRENLRDLIQLIEIDNSLMALVEEIKRTRRRVNALEYIIIPKLEAQAKWISLMLEEREREDFFRKKMIKKKRVVEGI